MGVTAGADMAVSNAVKPRIIARPGNGCRSFKALRLDG
jgi:hypothetical protein